VISKKWRNYLTKDKSWRKLAKDKTFVFYVEKDKVVENEKDKVLDKSPSPLLSSSGRVSCSDSSEDREG
jgi:hypothetical protein